jgi:F-type H+-transporting ATPase subunit a
VAAESGKIDPMHQFEVQTIWDGFNIAGHQIAFTNSALWMCVAALVLWAFMLGGMKRAVVPGRWQMMVENFTGFIDSMLAQNIGKEGRKYLPYIFSLFMFILFANVLGLLPLGLVGIHPFTFTSHFTVTGVLAIMSFSIVLIVGFWKHGIKFFKLFIPSGTPLPMVIVIFPIELVSFLFRPFSLGLRLRCDDRGAHSAQGACRLRHQRRQCQPDLGRRGQRSQLRADGRRLGARDPRRRHPGLCLCAAHVAVHQRRRASALSFPVKLSTESTQEF